MILTAVGSVFLGHRCLLIADCCRFFQYRWLLVTDPSCTDAVPVKLFTNSHQEDVERCVRACACG